MLGDGVISRSLNSGGGTVIRCIYCQLVVSAVEETRLGKRVKGIVGS